MEPEDIQYSQQYSTNHKKVYCLASELPWEMMGAALTSVLGTKWLHELNSDPHTVKICTLDPRSISLLLGLLFL